MKNQVEMAYMGCDHWKRYAAGTIPGAGTFENFMKSQVNSLQNGSIL
jgi:hypothetical protein